MRAGLRPGRPGFDSRQSQDFYFSHSVQTGSVAYRVSYPMDTGGLFLGSKGPQLEADHSPPSSSVEVKNDEDIPPLPDSSLWRGDKLSTGTTSHIYLICVCIYIYIARVLLFVLPCFSQTACHRKNVVSTDLFLLEKEPWEGIKFVATCMGSSPGQLVSPLLPL
jgi:hypothetical protein